MAMQLHDWRSSSALGQNASFVGRWFLQRVVIASRRLWRAHLDHQARRATRLALRALDERTMRDIGVSREQIACVVNDFSRPTR
jgi:uncharacterized protein YjiS (DUF1127 family)